MCTWSLCLVLDAWFWITLCLSLWQFVHILIISKRNTSKYGNFLISSYIELKIFICLEFTTSVFLNEKATIGASKRHSYCHALDLGVHFSHSEKTLFACLK